MISGCSGGGKSTLLLELARRGYATVAEPGRRIIAEARASGDDSMLPWIDIGAFARRALEISVADFAAASALTFFDRGIVDAAVALAASGERYPIDRIESLRYDRLFLAPPWPAIYVNDEDRRHSLEKALMDYDRVRAAYLDAGYRPVELPRDTVASRADMIETELGLKS